MDEIGAYLEDSDIEIQGQADVLSESYIDGDGEEVIEVGARSRRRGRRGPFNYKRFRIPSRVIQRAMAAPVARASASSYGAPQEGGTMTPLSVGQASAAALTLTAEPQVEFQPLRMLISAFDTATLADASFRIRVTDIKVGARTMFRAGGAADGVPATLFAQNWTGANPARYDAIRPGTQFSVTLAGFAAADVADVALVGRAG